MMKRIFARISILYFAAMLLLSSSVFAQEVIYVNVNSSLYVNVGETIKRITSGNPAIAIVKQVDPDLNTGFLVEAHAAGTTSVLVWNMENRIREYLIIVSPEDIGLAMLIQREIGLPYVEVKKNGEKILLLGRVRNQHERNRAVQIANFYVGGANTSLTSGSNVNLDLKASSASESSGGDIEINNLEDSGNVIDLLQMTEPTQIRLEAQVIDINSSDSKNLGFQYGYGGETGITITPGTAYAGESLGTGGGKGFWNNPFNWAEHHRMPISASLTALVENGKARILSRPNIITMSGEQASIQIGGEIPYTTSNLEGTTVNFRNYGIILQFKPIVDEQDRITVSVHAESSNMSGQTVDGQPILTTRRADSVVHLDSGSTMVIGGLMDSSDSKNLSKIPFLGDIPIIGEFFKYHSKSKTKRELLILITPTIVSNSEVNAAPMSQEMEKTYWSGYQESFDRPMIALDEGDLEDGERAQ
ncbi:MAG: pilus assembly protein N-terminal domain-containing protein [Selenomonadaceae bacterium]|nr:pilus assembly protein N-terminal domain-containing protein [Selenomonadaceae bacterium]